MLTVERYLFLRINIVSNSINALRDRIAEVQISATGPGLARDDVGGSGDVTHPRPAAVLPYQARVYAAPVPRAYYNAPAAITLPIRVADSFQVKAYAISIVDQTAYSVLPRNLVQTWTPVMVAAL